MSIDLVQERLNSYKCSSVQEEEHALREITQEIALAALSRSNFFKEASFHGGTCLRIFYTLNRFSEDLDFMLKKADPYFSLDPYLKNISSELKAFGYELEVVDRSKINNAVKKAFLKDNSLGKVLSLNHIKNNKIMRKIKIKIEVDINPPKESQFETKYLDFPYAFSVTTQDLPCLFAGKLHAILCRQYNKGRDWYDFLWYLSREISINFKFLSSALNQTGPWEKKGIQVDLQWCLRMLRNKINTVDWKSMKSEIAKFVKPSELPSINLWQKDFFLDRLKSYKNKI